MSATKQDVLLSNMRSQNISFSRKDPAKFFKTLNGRVNAYFKENKIKRTGNWKLWVKTIVMFTLFLSPYFLILTLDIPGWSPNHIDNHYGNWYGWCWYECYARR